MSKYYGFRVIQWGRDDKRIIWVSTDVTKIPAAQAKVQTGALLFQQVESEVIVTEPGLYLLNTGEVVDITLVNDEWCMGERHTKIELGKHKNRSYTKRWYLNGFALRDSAPIHIIRKL